MIKIGSNFANAIYLGLSAVDRLYYNGEMIWPDGLTYFVLTDGSVIRRLVRGQLLSTDVPDNVISAQVGDRVTAIGTCSFINQNTLSSITIPDSVQFVGQSAFENCGGLTSIEMPDSILTIYGSAFKGCSSLVSASIPDSVTDIQSNAFSGCMTLVSADLPGVKTLGANAFNNCSSLTAVEFSDQLSAIGEGAFKFAKTLSSIYIPNSVSTLNGSVFYGCTNLERVMLPSNITSIGGTCFKECRSLKTLNLPEQLQQIGSQAFIDCSKLSSIEFPEMLLKISQQAFMRCTSISSIQIPPSVSSVMYSAFEGCSSLTAVGLGQIPSIPAGMLNQCKSLPHVSVPDSVSAIGGNAFRNCLSLEVVNFGNTRTTVPSLDNVNAFDNVYSKYVIVVPDALYDTWIEATNWSNTSIQPHIVKWSEFYSFRFTAVDPGATVTFHKYGNPADAQIKTSIDADTWQPYEFGTTITLPNAGDTVYFRAKDENDISFYTDTNNRYWFQTSGADKKIAAAGNIQSLMKSYNKPLDISDKVYCYRGLFQTNKGLVAAPDLPATAMANSCYENMFQLCPALSATPALPATALANRCYANMFYNCTALSTAPVLSSEQTATACYQNMFGSCSSLTAVPYIPFKKVNKWTYQQTFQNCTSISGTVTIKLDPISVIPAFAFVQTFDTPSDQTSLNVIMDFSDFTAVPLLENYATINVFNNSDDPRLTIKVPASLLTTWKESSNWSNFADRIVAAT